jgi:hypothetical protein
MLSVFSCVSASVLGILFVFRCMLQMLHLDDSKVNRVLHLHLTLCCLASVSPSPPRPHLASAPPPLLNVGDIRWWRGPHVGTRKRQGNS